MAEIYLGIDIGGTKCAVIRGAGDRVDAKLRFDTTSCAETLARIFAAADELFTPEVAAIGVSCGSPLDSARGIIQAPPNLPDWVDVHITEMLTARYGRPAYLCNDADACALAEWQCGAGVGTNNMIFCTFGTGFGAGLILGGRLYTGACGGAGEIGHVTLHEGDPATLHVGYYKPGSVEGYCSGGGIAQYGRGSAKELAARAAEGDAEAIALWETIGADLGRTLAILVDLLNPDAIVLGSIYPRAQALLEPAMHRVLDARTLAPNRTACRILPARLGEQIGDIAALTVAALGGKNYAV